MSNAVSFLKYGDVAEFRNGLNFSKDSHGKGCKFIGVADFKDNFTPQWELLGEINPSGVARKEDYLESEDIIFVRSNGNKALVGRSLFIDSNEKSLYSGFCIRARLKTDDFLPLFLAYYTQTEFFKSAITSVAGTNINNLNQDILSNVMIPHYSIEVQKSIVDVLSSIDAKIALNNRINAELEAMAKSLYDYWFVQFDFPDDNGKPYKTSGGKMIYNTILKREIPINWEFVAISDILDIKTGKEDANFSKDNGRYHFFTCGEKTLYCDEFAFDGKAVLLAGNGSFSVKKYEGKFNAYQRTYVLMPKDENLLAPLYYETSNKVERFTSGSRGSIVKFITKGDIENIVIPLPKNRDLSFMSILTKCFSKSTKLYEENLRLKKLRDWLLPLLMNGQIKVK
ncbi:MULTISPECIES: restriction endonuclease subunit S [Enterobacteriaceae]|uniref:restriction endonuclease subunit S n=1 Tax=Enterobacteriaceae TaxID=543 RepID=UPI000C7BF464|nr:MULTISPECIES: restriction endonuclease subunit S [Enterobacteriaceae]EEV8629051.1 restriction endonuclease subunit S [Escherichia coli]EFA7374891.1 restriction endonuclease subunit S [Escherichia coli]EIB1403181.1 restriction endonuclease subunit S [Escherichia coli]MCB8827019.1 restriction endonuclease subunit S [Escherichia coli]MDZ8469509.1 restriction endonuclease subunit S [Escherichia coli]